MVSAEPHGHKQLIVGAFLFIYTHGPSVFPLHNISFCPIERSSQRHWCLSILSLMWIAESYKPIPANSTGLMGLIYCVSLSETGCQSLQSCISKQEVENCVVRRGSYKMHAQSYTSRTFFSFLSFLNRSLQRIAVLSMVVFDAKSPPVLEPPQNLFSHVHRLWNGLY